jgi:hypothetical protein
MRVSITIPPKLLPNYSFIKRQETRKKFKNAFQDQMITDLREGEGGQHSLLDERANFHVTKDGGLTEKFRTELR